MASIDSTTEPPSSLATGLSAGIGALPVPQRIVFAQALAGAVVGLVWMAVNVAELGSALLGGLVVLLPNGWLALQFRSTQPAGREVGQALAKFALTIALILLVFVVLKPSAAGFFSALVVCSLTPALLPMLTPSFLQPAKLAVVPKLPKERAGYSAVNSPINTAGE